MGVSVSHELVCKPWHVCWQGVHHSIYSEYHLPKPSSQIDDEWNITKSHSNRVSNDMIWYFYYETEVLLQFCPPPPPPKKTDMWNRAFITHFAKNVKKSPCERKCEKIHWQFCTLQSCRNKNLKNQHFLLCVCTLLKSASLMHTSYKTIRGHFKFLHKNAQIQNLHRRGQILGLCNDLYLWLFLFL